MSHLKSHFGASNPPETVAYRYSFGRDGEMIGQTPITGIGGSELSITNTAAADPTLAVSTPGGMG